MRSLTRNATGCGPKLSESYTAPMQKPQLVAVDTNVLMRLADRHEATLDAWQLIKHLLDIDYARLILLFRQLDLPAPLISSPEKLLKQFHT